MRLKLSLAVVTSLVAAGTAVLLAAPSADAIPCPPATNHHEVTVKGQTVHVCVPGQECDPRPCDPTAAPARD